MKTLDEFVALAKSKPGQLNYSMFEAGQLGHLWMEALFRRLGIQLQHVPYKSGVELVQAAASGDAAITISSLSSAQGAIDAGLLVPIMFTGKRPPGVLPDVPPQSKLSAHRHQTAHKPCHKHT